MGETQATPGQKAIWAAIENKRPFTLDDLELIAETPPHEALLYLQALVRAEYMRMTGARKAHSGEALVVFQLLTRHGPTAPWIDDKGRLVDPLDPRLKKRVRRPNETLFRPRILLAAEELGRPFFREEIVEAVCGEGPEHPSFRSCFAYLVKLGDVVRLDDNRYERGPLRTSDHLALFFRSHPDQWFTVRQLAEAIGNTVSGYDLQRAYRRLRCQGWTTETTKPWREARRIRATTPEADNG